MSKYGFKRPYEFKCPVCGYTRTKNRYSSGFVQWVDSDELMGLYSETYGCPKCGQTWNVEYKVSYELSNIELSDVIKEHISEYFKRKQRRNEQ